MKLRVLPGLSTFWFCLSALAVQAQTPPDAGVLQQQIDRERALQLPRRLQPEKPAEPAAMQPVAGMTVVVREFRFAGNTLISSEQLAPVVAEYIGRPLDFAQLQAAAAAVAAAYRQAGWIVRAYLPRQDITEGIVTLQIVEAVFGSVLLEGEEPARLKLSQTLSYFESAQPKGEPLNTDRLDRALLLADDLPGIVVAGTLQEGADQAETDLVLKLADEPLAIGEIAADNTGSRSTGKDRLTANLTLNSPLGFGDALSASAIHTSGSDYARLGYTVPVGTDGWRIGANVSHLRYALVATEYAALHGTGTSDSSGLEATYPLIRSRMRNLYLGVNLDHKTFDNRTVSGISSQYGVDALTATFSGNLFDSLGGGGANAFSLAWVSGRVDLDNLDTSEDSHIDGRYDKWRYSVSRQQVISENLSLYAQLSGQWARRNLDSSERFYLGGAAGVRAYPSSEGGGAEGRMLNLELRWKLPEGFSLIGFYDHGWIRVNHDNSVDKVGAVAALNEFQLKGYGLTLAWQTPFGANLKATWAHRLGSNPNPTSNGSDQDGTLIRNRYWFTVSLPF